MIDKRVVIVAGLVAILGLVAASGTAQSATYNESGYPIYADFEDGSLQGWDSGSVTNDGYFGDRSLYLDGELAEWSNVSDQIESSYYETQFVFKRGASGLSIFTIKEEANKRDGYYTEVEIGENDIVELQVHANTGETIDTGFTAESGTWHRMRYRIQDGTAAVKVWEVGTEEPAFEENNATVDIDTGRFAVDSGAGYPISIDQIGATTGEPIATQYQLSGTVTDQDDTPLPNATVELSQAGTVEYTTTTNATGQYSLTVDEGTYNATASKPGFINASGQVAIDSDTVLNFTLAESDKPYIGGGGTSDDGSSAEPSPRGGVLLDDQQTDLNFTVRDDSSSQINYTVFHSNSSDQFEQVGSGQVANNTRVSVPVTSLHGSNQWYVRVNDSINVQTSSVFRYRTPGIVTVFNGSSLNRLNDRTVDYVIRGANSNYRQEGSTSDGNISLNGVPDERLLIQADATDYYEQTIQVRNPALNYSVLLYPESGSGIPNSSGNYQQSFEVNDLTGDFPAGDTVLEVESYLNGQYQLIASESFGAANLANVTLQNGEQYRLKVRNNGRVRSLGDFAGDTSLSGQVVTLTVTGGGDDGDLETDPEGLWRYNASYNASQQAILAEFDGNDTNVQSVRVRIYERGNEGNVIYDSNYGAVESLQHTQPLTNEQANKTWWVEFRVGTNNTTQTARVLVGSGARDPTAALAGWIKLAISVIVILMTGALFSQANIGAGMIVTPLVAGGFVLIGWTGTALTGGTVVVALTVGLLINYGGLRP